MTEEAPKTCRRCSTPLGQGLFCPACGRKQSYRRLTFFNPIIEAFHEFVQIDSPMARTLRDGWNPGKVSRRYVDGDRDLYSNPVRFCLIWGTVAIFALSVFRGADMGMVEMLPYTPEAKEIVKPVANQVFELSHVWTLLSLPVLALLMRVMLFWRPENVAEHLVMCLYTYGVTFLIQGTAVVLGLDRYALIVSILYMAMPLFVFAWGAATFYRGWKIVSVIVSLIASVLYLLITGLIMFAVVAAIVYPELSKIDRVLLTPEEMQGEVQPETAPGESEEAVSEDESAAISSSSSPQESP